MDLGYYYKFFFFFLRIFFIYLKRSFFCSFGPSGSLEMAFGRCLEGVMCFFNWKGLLIIPFFFCLGPVRSVRFQNAARTGFLNRFYRFGSLPARSGSRDRSGTDRVVPIPNCIIYTIHVTRSKIY